MIEQYLNKVIEGDCLELMKQFDDKCMDLVLTDPPYNAKNIGPNQRTYSMGQMQLPLREYKKFCRDWFREATRVSKTLVFTPGIANICYYPQPHWVICWHKPNAVSFNRMGGFNAWEPIFIYGKPSKRLGQDYIKMGTFNFHKGPEKDHPCPKSVGLWNKLVEHFSLPGETILDPFMGSGTTAVSAKLLGRNFIGIELNPQYCLISEQRIAQGVINFNLTP